MQEHLYYLGAAAGSAVSAGLICWLVTPAARRLALQAGAAPKPRDRDVHREPVPRWGGLAIYLGFLLSLIVGVLVLHFVFDRQVSARTFNQGIGLALAGGILTVVGAIDDRYDLSAGKQILAQFLCAMLVIPFGVKIQFISDPFGPEMIDLHWWAYPITVLWLVAVANAVNWIDGIDGLAAGLSAISAATMAVMAAWSKQPGLTVLAAALAGSLLGFLPHNFNPARIFMGGGAQVVGFLLASISAVGAFKAPVAAAVFLPVLILALPIFDTAAVILKRWRAGRPIYQADQSHLHHRLMALGLTQRQTVLILYCISVGLCLVAVWAYRSL